MSAAVGSTGIDLDFAMKSRVASMIMNRKHEELIEEVKGGSSLNLKLGRLAFVKSLLYKAPEVALDILKLKTTVEIDIFEDSSQKTEALCLAARCNQLIVLDELIKHGFSKEDQDKVIVEAVISRNLDMVDRVLSLKEISVDARGRALVEAARFGYIDIVKALIADGSIGRKDIEEARAYALEKNAVDIFYLLFDGSWFFNEYRVAAMVNALEYGRSDVFALLFDNDIIPDKAREQCVIYAASWGKLAILQALLSKPISEKAAEVALKAVHLALEDRIDIIKTIFERCGVSHKFRAKLVAKGIELGDVKMVEYLLKDDFFSPEERGEAIIRVACMGNLDMLKYFISTGPVPIDHLEKAQEYAKSRSNFVDFLIELLKAEVLS